MADSSALIALSICNNLNLLEQLFSEVIVPEAVYTEIIKPNKPEALNLKNYLKDKVMKVDMTDFIYLDALADAGENEAMLLYKQKSENKLLIDDKRGRKVAKINGINTIGSLGVLVLAKKKGLIEKIKPSINKIEDSRVYISPALVQMILEIANE